MTFIEQLCIKLCPVSTTQGESCAFLPWWSSWTFYISKKRSQKYVKQNYCFNEHLVSNKCTLAGRERARLYIWQSVTEASRNGM